MTIQDFLTISALFLNFITLVVVGLQTKWTRESLIAAKESIDEDKKVRQLEALPKSDAIISVDVQLKMMQDHLQKIIKDLNNFNESRDFSILDKMSQRGVSDPSRIVDRRTYQHSPDWLKEMLMCGAQYHYNAICLEAGIKKFVEESTRGHMILGMLERYNESHAAIAEIRSYIKNRVPDFYLNSPASISESKFLVPLNE